MSKRGAGRFDQLIHGMETIATGVAYLLLLTVLSAISGGILWGLGYRIAKAIGGW